MKLSDEERDFMRLVFEETGGIPFKYVALTEAPVAAAALNNRRFIELRQSGPDTWAIAITGEGSAWAHLHFVGRRSPISSACKLTAEALKRKRP